MSVGSPNGHATAVLGDGHPNGAAASRSPERDGLPRLADLYELVRGPAALTALGDTVAGAAAAGYPLHGRRWLLPLSSAAFYWAGMAANDWADRELDAVERPERPIPSGRVRPEAALITAGGLTAAGLALARAGGGARALRTAIPLAAAIWAYDTTLKNTPFAPVGMAACRALDVGLGADGRWRPAAAAVTSMAVHTLGVTALSAGEVDGGSPSTARAALAATATSAVLAVGGRAASPAHRLSALAFGASYAATVGEAQQQASRWPSASYVRAATAAGIHGMVPLQAALAARHGAGRVALLLGAGLPLVRRLAKKVSPT